MLTPNDEVVKKADAKALKAAVLEDQRHRLHAEPATSRATASPYFNRWVRDYVTPVITAKSKRDQLIKQFGFPLISVQLVDEIQDMTGAVHNAQDKFSSTTLTIPEQTQDFTDYIEEQDLDTFITSECHNALYAAPNSFVVIDLPPVQTSAYPEPYVYLLRSDKVKAAKPLKGAKGRGLMEFVWFETDDPNTTYLYDQQDFSVWSKNVNSGLEWTQVGPFVPHNLPFCPVFKPFSDLDTSNPLVSHTVLRPLLSQLDRLIFWDAAAESNDLASAFMLFWYIKTQQQQNELAKLPFAGQQPANYVNGLTDPGYTHEVPTGYLEDGTPFTATHPTACKPVDKSTIYGPGSSISVPPPEKEGGDWRDPAGFIAPPVENLTYITDKAKEIYQKTLSSATGYERPSKGQAINEVQVMSLVQKSLLIYQYLAPQFELLERRILTSWAILRYGPDKLVNVSNSYGSRFVSLNGEEMTALYQIAKDAKLSANLLEELDELQSEYYARNDPGKRLRAKMLRDLTDYPYLSESELVELQINVTDPVGFETKVCLLGYVHRFERENELTLQEFGAIGNYQDRILQILTRFKEYGTERAKNRPSAERERENQPGTGGTGNSQPPTGND